MFLTELFNPNPSGYSDGAKEKDNSSPTVKDVRKTKLTLNRLNKLRVLNDIRTLEQQKKIKSLKTQYTPPAEAGGLGM